MNKQTLLLTTLFSLLAACGSEDANDYAQQKAPDTEPSNQTAETANEIPAPSWDNGAGVYGNLKAGEEDYYFIDVDFFSSGRHDITLTDLNDNLDLEVIDEDGAVYASEAQGTADEFVTFSTSDVSFFGDDIDSVRIQIKVYGATAESSSRFTLKFATFDDD